MPDLPPEFPAETVGAILARWRKRRKMTGQALGDRVGMSQAKISRLETGVVTAEPSDVRLIAEALEVPPTEVEHLVELAEHADDRLTEWTSAGHGSADRQREYARKETAAKELRVFQPAVVPGLVQTSEYARAVLTASHDGKDDRQRTQAVSGAVNARMVRNQILYLPDRRFHFLITEQVLRNRVCEPAEMIAQIHRLREVADFPGVQLRIIADGTTLPVPPYHGFEVADERWVSVDLFTSSVYSGGRKTTRDYRRVFDELEAAAVTDIDDILDRHQAEYARMLLTNRVAP